MTILNQLIYFIQIFLIFNYHTLCKQLIQFVNVYLFNPNISFVVKLDVCEIYITVFPCAVRQPVQGTYSHYPLI